MVKGHRIERKIEVSSFIELMKNYSTGKIECTKHTFFRLSEKQRKIFKCDNIKEYLFDKTPIFVGIQYNNCYAAFYKYKNKKFIRVMLDISLRNIDVVTFYIIGDNQLPNIK